MTLSKKHNIYIELNLSNPPSTGRELLCRNRQCVGLKQKGNDQIRMKINVGLHSGTDYTGVVLDRFYCIYIL